jgi:hypothetical protein
MEALQLMMRKLGEMEDEVLSKRRQDEDRFKSRKEQKKRNAKQKKASGEHLQLIRRLTQASEASHAVALGVPAMLGSGPDAPAERPSKRARQGDAGATASVDDPESFRIRHRSPGGVRALGQGVSEHDGKRLRLMDKIREFADFGKQGTSIKLSGLENRDRAAAHEYCEELEILHDSKGQDPHRYIVVRHPPVEGEDNYAGLNTEELAERFGDAVKMTVREANDKVAEGMKDEVDLGRAGWKKRWGPLLVCAALSPMHESRTLRLRVAPSSRRTRSHLPRRYSSRYYDMKLHGDDPSGLVYAYLEGLVWVMKYYYQGCASWDWFYP